MKFLSVIALIFITLKLLGTITWSWWLVLLPLYGGAALWVILVALFVPVLCSKSVRTHVKYNRR